MPPYDKRARQRGFNTRIPVYTLSGGVGKQAPSKRMPNEAEIMDNATPTLERSVEKRSSTNQISCYIDVNSDRFTPYGGLTLPNGTGGLGEVEPLVSSTISGTAKLTFSSVPLIDSEMSLKSSDGTIVNYLIDNNANSGYLTESTATVTFKDSPQVDGTITLTSSDGTSKTYIAKADGTVTDGALDGSGNVQFNNGTGKTINERAANAVKNLQTAIYASNGHNNNASSSLEFTATAQVDETITLKSTDGTEITYIGKSSGTSGDLSGSNVLFNVGASASASATALAAAINSTNGHNAVNAKATATWTFSAGPAVGNTIQLLGTTNLGTTVSKTFKAANSGSNGDLDGSDVKFLSVTNKTITADNLAQAINNKNGFGTTGYMVATSNASAAKATAVLTFTAAATENATVTITDFKGISKVYKAVNSPSGTATDFVRGDNRVASMRNFAASVNTNHNGTIRATYNSSGVVTLTQQTLGTTGNTSITPSISPNWAAACTSPTAFTGGVDGGDVTVTQAFGGTYGNTTITDSAGFASACSSAPPAAFTGGTSTGVNGTKFTTSLSTAQITIAQVAEGFGATSRIKLSSKFIDSVTGAAKRPSPRFGKLHAETLGDRGTLNLSQCLDGDTGNKTITVNKAFTGNSSSSFTRKNNTYVNVGSSANDAAKQLKTAISSDYGHNGKLSASVSTADITITQTVVGPTGNTDITYAKNFNSKLSLKPTVFTGGKNYNTLFDSEYITLKDVKGKTFKLIFDSSVKKENTTSKIVGTSDVTTPAQLAEAITKCVNLNKIRMSATNVSGSSKVVLAMDDRGGNGTVISGNSDYFNLKNFKGSMPEKDFFYYWFSISDEYRYLLVVDYKAIHGSEKLFYVYKIDTLNDKVEDQSPLEQPSFDTYKYITHFNDVKTAQESLEAITVGTNIYIVNKFVKAGFTSDTDGYLFDLNGNELNGQNDKVAKVDYKGKEITYFTSGLVDPDGTAQVYVPGKTYLSGQEVYTATGVWKALVDIRAESTDTFSSGDANETIIPADPGPPNYKTTFLNGNNQKRIYYPTSATDFKAVDLTGKARNFVCNGIPDSGSAVPPGVGASAFAEGMTPSVKVDSACTESACSAEGPGPCERTWKPEVKDSSGIVSVEGDIVYDTDHSRKTCTYDSSACGGADERECETCNADAADYYISLWQYLRPVEQIPVQDNKYVDLTKQYLGQVYSDFSSIKFPPHASDPTDIIDKVSEICDHPSQGENNTNLTGDAARTIGILYEGKEATDYYSDNCTPPNHEDPMNTHDYGLGKIIYVENGYAGLDPGYYRIDSATKKPYVDRIRTPFKRSRFDENRMPHKMTFTVSTVGDNASWKLEPENWIMRTTGDEETNPGPKLFEDGKQTEIKALGFFRNRLWFAGEDKVFSSRLNEINNFWITDPSSLTDEDPVDITCSYNKFTEVTSLTPFESYLFVNTASDVQFSLSGSENLVTPFTAEISPTSFYSTAPLVNPVLLGSQIYFFDKKRLYVYFNEKTVSINNAIEVSYHCPDYLPEAYGNTTVISSYDTVLFTDKDKQTDLYCYTNRYSGDQVIQNAFYRYIFDKPIEALHNWDNNVYYVVKRNDSSGDTLYHIEKQAFIEQDKKLPLVDHRRSLSISKANTTFDRDKDETTFTFYGYYNDAVDSIVVIDEQNSINVSAPNKKISGENINIQSTTSNSLSTKVVVNGNYLQYLKTNVYVGTKYKTEIQLSPQFYRDETNNVIDGILSLRTMHLRHHNTGNYRVEVTNRGRLTTPIEFSSKEISSRTDLLPLDAYILNGETVSKILGFGDEVKISLISDYVSPMNITNIELKGRFNSTYSSWVR